MGGNRRRFPWRNSVQRVNLPGFSLRDIGKPVDLIPLICMWSRAMGLADARGEVLVNDAEGRSSARPPKRCPFG
jgi:hypothetical protein